MLLGQWYCLFIPFIFKKSGFDEKTKHEILSTSSETRVLSNI